MPFVCFGSVVFVVVVVKGLLANISRKSIGVYKRDLPLLPCNPSGPIGPWSPLSPRNPPGPLSPIFPGTPFE